MKRHATILETVGKVLILAIMAAILLFPVLNVVGLAKEIGIIDPRKTAPIIRMQIRPEDKTTQAPQLFKEPLLSVSFDDGWETTFTKAYPMLQQYGIPTTQYVLSGELGASNYLSIQQLQAMYESGHQIACHSVNHPDLTTLGPAELNYELKTCQQVFSKYFGPIQDFASPYSATDDTTIASIKQYYRSQRNTLGEYQIPTAWSMNTPQNFNVYNINAIAIESNTTPAQITALIKYAMAHNYWIILTYHAIDQTNNPTKFGLNIPQMNAQLKAISDSRIRIVTIGQVLNAYLPGQSEF
jgi:peptidoglycan/xylan/chitin deacetylase (PgdA/CDA1 family)